MAKTPPFIPPLLGEGQGVGYWSSRQLKYPLFRSPPKSGRKRNDSATLAKSMGNDNMQ